MNTQINPASTDFLQNILSLFKNAGAPNAGPILRPDAGGYAIHDEDTYLKDESRFLEGMHNLNQLRDVRQTLLHLLSSVERTQATLRSAMHPAVLARGIDHLPEEILSYILTLAGSSSWKSALRLSWVSRHFRAVALATPHLWSKLPPPLMDDLSREALSCFMERSKSVGLIVDLPLMVTEEYLQRPGWTDVVHMLMTHKDQWKTLILDLVTVHEIVDETEDNGPVVSKLKFPEATLKSVEHLIIADSAYRFLWQHYGSDFDWFCDASPEFYSGWKFPNLKTLASEMRIPPPNILPGLTEFTLDLSLNEGYNGVAEDSKPLLETLAAFLNSQPGLKTFKLIVGEYRHLPVQGPINLPELTTLHLENRYAHVESLRTLRKVSRALEIPGIKTISLNVSVAHINELGSKKDGMVKAFFPQGRKFTELETFRLDCYLKNTISSRTLSEIEWFPSVNNVEITTTSAPIISEDLEEDLCCSSGVEKIQFRDFHPDQKTVVREYRFSGEGMSLRSFFE